MVRYLSPSLALLLLAASSSGWAADTSAAKPQANSAVPAAPNLDERVTRLEQILKSQSLLDMLSQLDELQQENRQLRGDLEEQTHLNAELKQRLDDMYRDLNRRVSQLERVTSGNGAQGAAAAPQNDAESTAYQKAFEQLRNLHYDQAVDAFTAFLKSYPNGSYAHIAQYWLGEACYARHDFTRAITEYTTLGQRFPDSPKLPEAMLKIGYSYNELGKADEAKKALNDLIARFPQSPEAQQAQAALQGMGGEAATGR